MKSVSYSSLSHETIRKLRATSNFADYYIHAPYIACAWMDFHIDKDEIYNYDPEPFRIKIISAHPNAVLVHRVMGQYVIDELIPGKIIEFDQLQSHGLVPRKLANKIIIANRVNVPGYKKWKTKIDGNAFKAKLIWEWDKEK